MVPQEFGNNMGYGVPPSGAQPPPIAIPTQLFSDPLVANVAMTYGTKIMESGREVVDREIGKYVPVTRLKYYFAVDTSYVLRKLKLLFFPFTHTVSVCFWYFNIQNRLYNICSVLI